MNVFASLQNHISSSLPHRPFSFSLSVSFSFTHWHRHTSNTNTRVVLHFYCTDFGFVCIFLWCELSNSENEFLSVGNNTNTYQPKSNNNNNNNRNNSKNHSTSIEHFTTECTPVVLIRLQLIPRFSCIAFGEKAAPRKRKKERRKERKTELNSHSHILMTLVDWCACSKPTYNLIHNRLI